GGNRWFYTIRVHWDLTSNSSGSPKQATLRLRWSSQQFTTGGFMAGYALYSLDSKKFQALIDNPTQTQLAELAEHLNDGLDEFEGQFDVDDEILDWDRSEAALIKQVQERLARKDWYDDLSQAGQQLWEGVIFGACLNSKKLDVDFRSEGDG